MLNGVLLGSVLGPLLLLLFVNELAYQLGSFSIQMFTNDRKIYLKKLFSLYTLCNREVEDIIKAVELWRIFSARRRDSIRFARYMLSPVRLSVCHMGGS